MTDNEIIKALECCGEANNCIYCEYEPTKYQKGTIGCSNELMENVIDLIKRQQVTIEQLEAEVDTYVTLAKDMHNKAIKEFAEMMKEIASSSVAVNNGQETYETKCYNILAYKLDNLVKKMVGANNEN